MDEWGVVLVVTALAGLMAAVIKPIITLNTTITRLVACVDVLEKNLAGLTLENAGSHKRLWDKVDEQGETLQNHDKRILTLEHR